MEDFNEFIESCGLIDMKSDGSKFSWCNGQGGLVRSWSKLDRSLVNSLAVELFPDAIVHYLPRTTSDHAPLMIHLKPVALHYGPSAFKFQQMWVSHVEFKKVVIDTWNGSSGEMGLFGLAGKLKRMKVVLKDWNVRVFGKMDAHISELEQRIESLEIQLQNMFSEEIELDMLVAREELAFWTQCEETRLSQQVKLTWIAKGKASAQFFKAFGSMSKTMVHEMRLQNGVYLRNPFG
ncbi:uncharacterized protein LOC121258175 [Juglans microcarpa x Juglans regia]|uniref:uncharacterized protein LOC121258175 n=1 Tax=Juglans microcarpa x Juglans regia TaxID=2249226 RepID=UPI001B7E1E17|nr:uncharacterized protein LOC121258175 [Juglans microcarpa x Juglans regia]